MVNMTITNKTLLVLLLFILAIGCNDGCNCTCGGCTTRKIIDDEHETRHIDGVKVRITANKVQSTNRTLNWRGGPDLFNKSIWFSANYDLEIADRPELKEICEYYVDENQDLEKTLKEFSMKFSPDKNHFAVGRVGKVWDFYHFLETGSAFPSWNFYFRKTNIRYDTVSTLDFNKISWNLFPKPDQLFDTLLIQYGNQKPQYFVPDPNSFLSIMKDLKPGNSHELFLINNWYCEMANLQFSEARVGEIVKVSPVWKSTAITKIFNEIEKNPTETRTYYHSLVLLMSINDEKSLHKADDLLFKNPKYDNEDTREYFLKRFENKEVPLKSEIQKDLISKAKSAIEIYPKEFSEMNLSDAVDIVLSVKDDNTLIDLIKKINTRQNPDSISVAVYVSDLTSQTIDKYDSYSKTMQNLIVSEYKIYLNNTDQEISQFDVQRIYDFLKDKISCVEATKIYKKFESKLQFSKKPC
jgi:hypothetical protein